MRNPFKRQPRPAEKPTLRERAATLKSGLARLLTRPEGQGEANQRRRALVAGSVAAAIPLPVLARAASPAAVTAEALPLALPALITTPHPDRALLDLADALDRAIKAEAEAQRASSQAWEAVRAVLIDRPAELVPSEFECGFFGSRSARSRSVPGLDLDKVHHTPGVDRPTDCWGREYAWKPEGLRLLIKYAVAALGQGGQTPHRIRHWRALLPTAEAFDGEVAAAMAATGYERLSEERRAAEATVRRLRRSLSRTTATTPEGLAVHVRFQIGADSFQEGQVLAPLFRSAAAVAGVTLPASDFDVPAWVSAWEQAGGTIKWIPHEHDERELGFVWPRASEIGPEKTAELQRLSRLQSENSTTIHDWLEANR